MHIRNYAGTPPFCAGGSHYILWLRYTQTHTHDGLDFPANNTYQNDLCCYFDMVKFEPKANVRWCFWLVFVLKFSWWMQARKLFVSLNIFIGASRCRRRRSENKQTRHIMPHLVVQKHAGRRQYYHAIHSLVHVKPYENLFKRYFFIFVRCWCNCCCCCFIVRCGAIYIYRSSICDVCCMYMYANFDKMLLDYSFGINGIRELSTCVLVRMW